jgi:DUF1680 family protein
MKIVALGVLAVGVSLAAGPVKNRAPLPADALYPLPLTSVKPEGWLRNQLEIQARGLSGKLDEFWPSVGPDSGWLGGKGESWERGPYYMDGLVPLAFLLKDPYLIAKAHKWVRWTLENQRPDGSIGPSSNKDWWPNMVMLKVLAQYQEATGDERVIPLMERYVRYQLENIKASPLKSWGAFRWGDEVLSLVWLYNRTGDGNALELAHILHEQGFDWKAHFADFQFTGKTTKEQRVMQAHVVNNAMALKTATVWSLVSGEKSDRDSIYQALKVLDEYHLLPNGVHSGDEHYAGKSPVQGTELCAVVEGMFSFENLAAILGDAALADRLEKIAYNPLPGTFTADMGAHQYDQQPNQALVSIAARDWTSNNKESNLFGLEPNFGCCTANFHQGWPKFAASLWMGTADDGLAAVAYAPSEVDTVVRGGVRVKIEERTEYPFRETIAIEVSPEREAAFPLALRVPGWAEGASIKVNGRAEKNVKSGSFHRIERAWRPGDRVAIVFPMKPRVSRGYNNGITIDRGPLVYSLRIGEDWRKIRDKTPAADWEVHPATPWNYALLIDEKRPERSVKVVEKPVGKFPFSSEGAPVELRVKARRLPQWKMENDSAAPPPESPVKSAEPLETVTLIPYGSAKLRITVFPQAAR